MSSHVGLEGIRIGKLALADEMMLLGGAMLAAQKLEFVLYGMASHLKEKNGKFKGLNPEEFLRGDGRKTRETLGAIVKEFGARLLIDGEDLNRLVSDRNLIAHNYWRLTKANIRGGRRLVAPEDFLFGFTVRCEKFIGLCQGWVAIAKKAAAEMEGREDDSPAQVETHIQAYLEHLAKRAVVK